MLPTLHNCNLTECRWSASTGSYRRLSLLLSLILGFAIVEWLVGSTTHSLALQSDAGHMLTDAGAILLALSASWFTRLLLLHRPLGRQPRLEFITALINSVGLLLMAGLIGWEAWHHLQAPPQVVLSGPMLGTAIVGLVVNGIGVWMLHRDSHQNLNIRGAFLHTLADLMSSFGVIVGAITIYLFNCFWLDSAISLMIALLIAGSALPLMQQSWRKLAAPIGSLDQHGFLEVGRTNLSDHISF
jgi:cobalt-zinc-cadmium efflux system protein